jgi:hypothetical protein
MIPEFNENGNLPPGIHFCTWSEFLERFGTTPRRLRLIEGLKTAMEQLQTVGCQTIYIDGSFVTEKLNPGDFDACWDENGVDFYSLQALAPTLYNFAQKRAEQKARYRGEIFPANYPANSWGTLFIDFFQFDTRTDTPKGIIAINLVEYSS